MLKIKDNVDLKELEKFEFIREGAFYSKKIANGFCVIAVDSRIIQIGTRAWACAKILADLFDLIQAGLVEKVVERD